MTEILRSEPVVLLLPWTAPPIRSNDRRHWTAQHRLKTEVRQAAGWVCRQWLQRHGSMRTPVTATIIWHVADRRRRDAGASSPTLKVVLDAAVEVGLLPDDNHRIVVEERCRIDVSGRKAVEVVLAPAESMSLPALRASQALLESKDRESHQRNSSTALRRFGGDAA